MRTVFSSFRVVTTVAVLGLLACVSSGAQAQQVTVGLTSGGIFTAAIDERTDTEHLWIRFDAAGTSLLRPVAWSDVEAAWIGEEPVTVSDLQVRAIELATATTLQWRPSLDQAPALGGPTYAEQATAAMVPAPQSPNGDQ